MNTREHTRAYNLFASSHKGNSAQQESNLCCAFRSALPARVRTFVLMLVITAMTFVASPLLMEDEAYAYLSDDRTTAVVADFDELKKAVEGSDGYANAEQIIIDPQAAVDFAENENAQVSYGDGAFYIPIEQPIRVSRPITITNAEGVQVVFARSAKGGNGEYDSKAFAGANGDWPAFFNVINSRGKLTIEGDIVMSGEQVSADFNEADASFSFDAEAKEWSRGNGTGIVDGGYFLHSVSGGEIVVGEGVQITGLTTDSTVKNASPVYLGGGSTYIMNGGAITGNDFGVTARDVADATTAGAITVEDNNTTATLNEGEISGNVADVAGVFVKEGASLDVAKKFNIDENEIYRVDDAKATEESTKGETRDAAPQETTAAPKRSLKSTAPQLRNGGSTNQTPQDPTGTRTVATSKQLKDALTDPTVNTIIIDPTGALKEVSNKDQNGVINPQVPTVEGNGVFYLPVDEPLEVNRAVTIKTKSDNTQAIIARSDKFTAKTPIFTVKSGGNLTLSKGVVMTGDRVDSVYDYADGGSGYDPGTGITTTLDTGVLKLVSNGKYFAVERMLSGGLITPKKIVAVDSGAKKLALNNGFLEIEDPLDEVEPNKMKRISYTSELRDGQGNDQDYRLVLWDEEEQKPASTHATSLEKGKIYLMAWKDANKNWHYAKLDSSKDNGIDNNNTDASQAIKLKALPEEADEDGEEEEEEQTYENVKFKFNVTSPKWSQADAPSGTKDAPKGFFVQVESGGTLNVSGAILKDYKTVDTYSANETDATKKSPVWSAPVVVMGTFNMTAGEITGNRVGYCANDADSDWRAQHIKTKLLESDLTNTAGGVLFKGSNATGTISGTGAVRRNKGDSGGIIVTAGAKVTLDGAADGSSGGGIDGNLGWHHAGAALVDQGGTLHMKGGHMVNNTTWNRGGAVWATEWGTNGLVRKGGGGVVLNPEIKGTGGNFVMDNGKLDNNMAFIRGGAINVESDGVQLKNGYITNNKCKSLGGAIYVEGDSADYTYTLVIKQGYISNNTAVQGMDNAENSVTLAKKIDSSKDNPMEVRASGTARDNWDKDFPDNPHNGNGGGIWLCPLGGTSVLAYNGNNDYKVVIDGNTSTHGSKTWYGDDFYICRGKGSALVQNLVGDWYDDKNNKKTFTNGTIVNGMIGLYNKDETTSAAGVQITGNRSRDGGGIAANGTLILGKPDNVHRYTAKLDITKEWQGVAPEDITLRLFYKNGNTRQEISNATLTGHANTSFSEDDDAVNQIIEGAPTNNNTKWHATVEIPAIYQDKQGNEYVLYEIEDPDNPGTAINLRTTSGVAKLYNAIKDNKELKILNWYLELEESTGNFSTIKSFQGVIDKAQKTEEIVLTNPVTGETVTNGRFNITFSTITFGETLINKLKNVDLTKVGSNNQPLPNATFELHPIGKNGDNLFVLKSKVEENNAENPGADDPLEVVESNDQGKITLTKLDVNSKYFLFETSIREDGKHARAKSPWLIEVDDNGNATTKRIKDEYYGVWHNAKAVNNGYQETFSTYADNDEIKTWVTNKRWKYSWFVNTDTAKTLKNMMKPVELTKTDASGNVIKKAATFKVFEARDSEDSGKTNWVPTGAGTTVQVDPSTGKFSIADVKYGKTYMIFETTAPEGYIRAVDPWLLKVENNGTITVEVKENGYELKHWDRAKYNETGDGDTTVSSDFDHTSVDFGSKEWPKTWFKSNGGTNLKNRKAAIVLEKTDDANDPARIVNNTAKFMIFDTNVNVSDLFDGNGNAKTGNQDVKVRDKNAPIGGDANGYHTTDAEGFLSIDNLDTDKIYLLFEAEAPQGYERSKAPWLIWVDKSGEYRIFKYVAEKVKYTGEENPEDLNQGAMVGWNNERSLLGSMAFPTTAEGYGVPEEMNTNGFNFVEQIGDAKGKLKNKPIIIEFDKTVTGNDDLTLTSAKFDLYYAYAHNAGNHWEYRVDTGKGTNGKVNTSPIVARTSDGKYRIDIPKANQIYLLFETEVPDGYVDPVVPWGIYVDADGGVEPLKNTDYGIWRVTSENITVNKNRFNGVTDPTNIYLNCNEIEQITTYALENTPKPIELVKVDETPNKGKLGGAKFVICEAVSGSEKDHGSGHKSSHYWVKNARVGGTKDGSWIPESTITSTAIKGSDNQPRVFESEAGTGKIKIDNLAAGDYLLFEYQAPTGFVRASSPWVINVRDTSAGRTVTVKKVKDVAKGKALYGKGDATMDIAPEDLGVVERWWDVGVDDSVGWFETLTEPYELANEPKYLLKVDKNTIGNPKPGLLPGGTYHLYDVTYQNNNTYIRKKDTPSVNLELTSVGGKISLPSSVTKVAGDYLLVEDDAPSGYKTPTKPFRVQVDSSGNITVSTLGSNAQTVSYNTKTWWRTSDFTPVSSNANYKNRVPNESRGIKLWKVDGYTKDELDGAVFHFYKLTFVSFKHWKINLNDPAVDMGTSLPSGSDGTKGSVNIPTTVTMDGSYLMFEDIPPTGYEKSTQAWVVQINEYNNTQYAEVWPAKVESTGSVYTNYTTENADICHDNEIENFPTISLTKVELNDGVIKGTDNNGDETITLDTTGDKINYLQGVGFKLYEANTSNGTNHRTNTWTAKTPNRPVMVTGAEADGTVRTDKDGVLDLGALSNGKYLLRETEEKTGYVKPDNPWRLVVENGTVTVYAPVKTFGTTTYVKVNPTAGMTYITNSKIYVLPHSGGMGTYWFMVVGAMMMAFAAAMIFARRRGVLT